MFPGFWSEGNERPVRTVMRILDVQSVLVLGHRKGVGEKITKINELTGSNVVESLYRHGW